MSYSQDYTPIDMSVAAENVSGDGPLKGHGANLSEHDAQKEQTAHRRRFPSPPFARVATPKRWSLGLVESSPPHKRMLFQLPLANFALMTTAARHM